MNPTHSPKSQLLSSISVLTHFYAQMINSNNIIYNNNYYYIIIHL